MYYGLWTGCSKRHLFAMLTLLPYSVIQISWAFRTWDFPGGSDNKEFVNNSGDPGLIPGSGRSAGEGNGNPLQSSCLENSMDRGA